MDPFVRVLARPARALLILALGSACSTVSTAPAEEVSLRMVRAFDLGAGLVPLALRVAQTTHTYGMIAEDIGAEAAKSLVEGELMSIAPSLRGEWEMILARCYLDHFSPEELESITREGRQSPYAAKLASEEKDVRGSLNSRGKVFFAAYVAKALTRALEKSERLAKASSSIFTTKLYELVVEYPMPVWASTPAAVGRSHFNRKQVGRQFYIEQIPEEDPRARDDPR